MFDKLFHLLFAIVAATHMACDAFTPISPLKSIISTSSPLQTSSSKLNLAPEFMTVDGARRLFFLWFFGASGGGGIAVGAFPKMYQNFQDVQALKGVGPTLGGGKIGLSPLCGYPEDLALADVQKILNNKMTTEQMVQKGPKDSFWAERGYLRYEAFEAANKNCNPLALRAIFDAMTTSVSTVSPVVAQELLDSFRDDIGNLKRSLLISKAQGYSSIIFLFFLLGIAGATCTTALQAGWFPEWPGDNIFTIPEYWI